MSSGILIVSSRDEDEKLGEEMAAQVGTRSIRLTQPKLIRSYLEETPNAVTIWDADFAEKNPAVSDIVFNYCEPRRLFLITDQPLRKIPGLLRYQMFHHHLVRKPKGPAWNSYAKLAKLVLSNGVPSIADHFAPNTPIKKIAIKEASHKFAATEAIQKYLVQQKIGERIASVVSQAVDELMVNAIFDAPVNPSGSRIRHKQSRTEQFVMAPNEHVEVELAANDEIMGICVTDHFGSLRRKVLMETIGKHYYKTASRQNVTDMDSGLGLRGIYDSGLSLLFAGIPDMETWAMIFFRKTETYRDFRNGPHFLSLLLE